jgi:hypothetical protein
MSFGARSPVDLRAMFTRLGAGPADAVEAQEFYFSFGSGETLVLDLGLGGSSWSLEHPSLRECAGNAKLCCLHKKNS